VRRLLGLPAHVAIALRRRLYSVTRSDSQRLQ
jgi:hypothetical protein